MKSDSGSSGSSSGGASQAKPPAPETPPEKLTEAEYIQQQAHNAKLALGNAWEQVKVRLGQGVAPQAWAKEYPWVTVGAAAVAGFVAAATLIPSKEEQALKKLAAIERALHPAPAREAHSNGDKPEGSSGGGMLGSILREVVKAARPVVMSMIAGRMGAAGMPGMDPNMQSPNPEDPESYSPPPGAQ